MLATQNPIGVERHLSFPEAQLDRFMFDVVIDSSRRTTRCASSTQTTAGPPADISGPVQAAEDVLRLHQLIRTVPVAEESSTTPSVWPHPLGPAAGRGHLRQRSVSWGAGAAGRAVPGAGGEGQGAAWQGRAHVDVEDIRASPYPTLRHRIFLSYPPRPKAWPWTEIDPALLERRKSPPAPERTAARFAARVGGADRAKALMGIRNLACAPGWWCRVLERPPPQPHHGLLGRVHADTASTRPATIPATSTGGCTPDATASSSSGSRTRPTCAAICSGRREPLDGVWLGALQQGAVRRDSGGHAWPIFAPSSGTPLAWSPSRTALPSTSRRAPPARPAAPAHAGLLEKPARGRAGPTWPSRSRRLAALARKRGLIAFIPSPAPARPAARRGWAHPDGLRPQGDRAPVLEPAELSLPLSSRPSSRSEPRPAGLCRSGRRTRLCSRVRGALRRRARHLPGLGIGHHRVSRRPAARGSHCSNSCREHLRHGPRGPPARRRTWLPRTTLPARARSRFAPAPDRLHLIRRTTRSARYSARSCSCCPRRPA